MAANISGIKLGAIAEQIGGELRGDPEFLVLGPAPAESNDARGLAFAEGKKYLAEAENSGVGAVIVPPGTPAWPKPTIVHPAPRLAFGLVLAAFARPLPIAPGINASAVIDETAVIDPTASLGPFVTVGPGSVVGAHAVLHPFVFVGDQCKIGSKTILYPHVVLVQDVEVGDRTVIHSGTILGADGFGYAWDGQRRHKIPQVGRVVIGNDVEIGANTTIDRATCGETRVGDGTKIDNLTMIAHNVQIGENTVVAGQAGISGSSKIGDRVVLGGQVGIADHHTVGDDITLGGQTGVLVDVLEPGAYQGVPAMPVQRAIKVMAIHAQLPELLQRIRSLEKEVERLKNGG